MRTKQKKVGAAKKQIIDGISPITYGWIDKSNRRKFYTTIGCHSKINVDNDDYRFLNKLQNNLHRRISSLTRDNFKDIVYPIIIVDIPADSTIKQYGFITVDVTISNRTDISNNEIESFNSKIVDILLDTDCLTIFPTRKY